MLLNIQSYLYISNFIKQQPKINNSEFYIAPFYQFAIDNNYDVKICEAYDVKVYGTPTELLKTFKINRDDFLIENKLEL